MRLASRARVVLSVPLLVLAACGDDVSIVAPAAGPVIRSVSVTPQNATLRPGETLVMVARVEADSGFDRSVSWASADPRRATVSANGIVTAVSQGYAVITATSRVRSEFTASATIEVLAAPTVRSVSITPAALTMRVGQSVPLVANVQADSGVDRSVIWTSTDPSRISISATGVVTGIADGTAVVTATSRLRAEVSGSAAITVIPASTVRSIALTPAVLDLAVGTQSLMGVVVQADDGVSRAVTYASTNPAVATVSASGVVAGVSVGTSTITVAAVAAPSVTATAVVNVRERTPPQVSIQRIAGQGSNLPVDLQRAFGQLDVTLDVTPGQDPLATVDLVLNQNGQDVLVATQAFLGRREAPVPATLAAARAAPIVLSFRSDKYDPETGDVSFRNGPVTIRAVARSVATGAGSSQSASNTVQLTLANVDGFHVALQALSSTTVFNATDAGGRAWVQAGNGVAVRSVPVLYSGSVVASRTISFPGDAPAATLLSNKPGIATDTLLLPGYTSPATGAAYLNGELPSLSAVSTGGATMAMVGTAGTGGAGIVNAQAVLVAGERLVGTRVDNAPPPAGAAFVISMASANSNNWVNGAYPFASGLSGIVPDAGVGLPGSNLTPTPASVGATFRVTGGALTDTAVVAQGSLLAATTTHLAYSAVARYADRLGNVRNVALSGAGANPLSTFGVDLVAPTVRYLTSPIGGTLSVIGYTSDSVYTTLTGGGNPLAYGVEAIDDRSGFGARPVKVMLERLAQPNPSGQQTGTRTCVVGIVVAGACTPDSISFSAAPLVDAYRQATTVLDGGTAVEGYYTWTAIVRDQAGNAGTTWRKQVLYDQGTGASAPALASAGVPAFMRGGQPAAFAPVATDNVEVVRGQLYLAYPNLPTTQILAYEGGATGSFAVGTPFDALLTSPLSGGPGFTISSFIRAMESTDVNHAPQAYSAATVKPVAANVVVRDVPGSTPATLAANTAILPGTVETALGTPGFINLTGPRELRRWRPFAGGTSPLRMEAVGPSGQTDSPFVRVILAHLVAGVGPNAQVWRILSEATTPTSLDNGLERVWRYDLGTQLPSGSYIAIGVTADGDAIVSQVIVI